MKKEAKQYSAEEKAKVALEVPRGELTVAQISSKYGIHATQITHWKKQALESMVMGFKEKRNDRDPDKNLINELYQQIGQLTVERDWIKKKSALFNS